MSETSHSVHEFLNEPVPPTGTDRWLDWRRRASELPPDAPVICIETLRTGPEPTHYAALLVLREFGFEVWGEDYGTNTRYKFRAPGETEWTLIFPDYPPPDYAAFE